MKLFFPIFRVLFYYLKFCWNSFENDAQKLGILESNYEQDMRNPTKKTAWTMSLTEQISNIFEHFQLKYLLPWPHTSPNDWYVRWPALTHFQQENEKWIMPLHLLSRQLMNEKCTSDTEQVLMNEEFAIHTQTYILTRMNTIGYNFMHRR